MATAHLDWSQFVLILIDVQRDFWTETLAQSHPLFPTNITQLLDLCRSEGIEIVHLRASFSPDMSDWIVRYKLLKHIPCVQGTPGIEVLPFARDNQGEMVFAKQTFDGFLNPQLPQYLRRQKKRFVLAAGLLTSVCVLFTTISAAQSGFLTGVVEDCCADEPAAHTRTLDQYDFIFDRVTINNIPSHYSKWLSAAKQLDEMESKLRISERA
jgi:nicotinamidase-related amidase